MSIYVKICLTAVGLLLAYVVFQYIRTRHYIQLGVPLANSAVRYEQHPTNPTIRLLTIGDSTVVGTGASKPEDSVAGLIGHDYPTMDITNAGKNGARLADLPAKFAQYSNDQFDVVLVQIGGNDVWRFTPFTDIESSLNTVLAEAERVGKHVIILHGGDFKSAKALPLGTRWLFSWRSSRLRDLYKRVIPTTAAQYVDLWTVDLDNPERAAAFYAVDRFHPSSSGYADWYAGIKPALSSVISFEATE